MPKAEKTEPSFLLTSKPTESQLAAVISSLLEDAGIVQTSLASATQRSLVMGAKLVLLRDLGHRGVLKTTYKLIAEKGISERTAKNALALTQAYLVHAGLKAQVRDKLSHDNTEAMQTLEALVKGDWQDTSNPVLNHVKEWLGDRSLVEILRPMSEADYTDHELPAPAPAPALPSHMEIARKDALHQLTRMQHTAAAVEEVLGALEDAELLAADEAAQKIREGVAELMAQRKKNDAKLKKPRA